MKKAILTVLAVLALGLTLVPSLLVFSGKWTMQEHRTAMAVGCVLWFVVAPFWMPKEKA
jgi:hypothetical protein